MRHIHRTTDGPGLCCHQRLPSQGPSLGAVRDKGKSRSSEREDGNRQPFQDSKLQQAARKEEIPFKGKEVQIGLDILIIEIPSICEGVMISEDGYRWGLHFMIHLEQSVESVAASAVQKGAGGRGTLCPGLGRKEKPRGMGTDLKDKKGQCPQSLSTAVQMSLLLSPGPVLQLLSWSHCLQLL
ncbi:hypothetical protein MUG91_G9n185 [Manis pentadactyla]|nr:hypothetical protein MUG91_G9n185 [Manis pentadactyla]